MTLLDDDGLRSLARDMWALRMNEMSKLDRIYEFSKGRRGRPTVPESAGDELKDLAKLSILNVLDAVVNGFARNLSVVGYRATNTEDNDPAWAAWQRNRMDARQYEVHRPALRYGASYVTVLRDEHREPVWRARSPRQLLAVYDDPQIDEWPQYALETWVTTKNAKPRRVGFILDDIYQYPIDLGELPVLDGVEGKPLDGTRLGSIQLTGDPVEHGAVCDGENVCPVVRFIDDRDADDQIVGEVEPLIDVQRTINEVNFDRLIAARWGVNPMKVISGWTGTKTEVERASSMRVWTFDDPEVRVQSFAPGSVEPYNAVIDKYMEHVSLIAGLSPTEINARLINVSQDTVAMAEAKQRQKLGAMRDSFGESWEQVLRLSASMDGDTETAEDTAAEVIWRDTESRTFGAVVDGVTKLASSGVPIEELIDFVPGMTQQRADQIRRRISRGATSSLVDKLTASPVKEVPAPPAGAVDQALSSGGSASGT